jgi:hypothetical protein
MKGSPHVPKLAKKMVIDPSEVFSALQSICSILLLNYINQYLKSQMCDFLVEIAISEILATEIQTHFNNSPQGVKVSVQLKGLSLE